MAKVSAHGSIIGTIEFTTTSKRYMSDGAVLKNYGNGWKLAGKVKAGIDPERAYKNAVAFQAEFMAQRPALAKYRKELHGLCGISKRWKLHTAIQLMPDDADGVWSSACDDYCDNVNADVDEIGALCRMYLAACAEHAEINGVSEPVTKRELVRCMVISCSICLANAS